MSLVDPSEAGEACVRLVSDPAASGARNMALDEAWLRIYEASEAPPPIILRLYSWEVPTLSLGRFQSHAEALADPHAAGLPVVRRPSGGGAILHGPGELTYAVIAAFRVLGTREPRAAYARIHAAVADALARLGVGAGPRPAGAADEAARDADQDADHDADTGKSSGHDRDPAGAVSSRFFCFNKVTDFDLVSGDRKLVGSAQFRLGKAFLQHGSIPLRAELGLSRATSVSERLGRPVSRTELEGALALAFADHFDGVSDQPSDAVEPAVLAAADRLEREKYATGRWTRIK